MHFDKSTVESNCNICGNTSGWSVWTQGGIYHYKNKPDYYICDKCHDICVACAEIEKMIQKTRSSHYKFSKRCIKHKYNRRNLKHEDVMMYCVDNCPICNITLDYNKIRKHGNATLDRLIPGARGGEYTRDNICVICHDCNVLKSDICIDDIDKTKKKLSKIYQLQQNALKNQIKFNMKYKN